MTDRIKKINELVKREIAVIILRETDFSNNALITVTRVETSVDMRQASVYISAIPQGQNLKIVEILNRLVYGLQKKLNKRLKTKLIPRIKFVEEKETGGAARVEQLLDQINTDND